MIFKKLVLLHRLRIKQMFKQGRPFPFVPKFVHDTHTLEISPANQIGFVNSNSLIGR